MPSVATTTGWPCVWVSCGEVDGSAFLEVVGDLGDDADEEEEPLEEVEEVEEVEDDEFLRLCFGSRTLGRPENVMMGYQKRNKKCICMYIVNPMDNE